MTRAIAPPDPDVEPPAGLDRVRVLASAAMGTILVSYAILVPTSAALIYTGGRGSSLDATFAAAVPLWLAAHQVPLAVQGQQLSVLPLLPTAAVIAVVALGASWAVRRLGGRAAHDGGAVLATVGGAHTAVAVLATGLLPAEVSAGPWTAMPAAALVAVPAAGMGVLRACGVHEVAARWRHLPPWVLPGLRGAVVGVATLAVLGAAVLTAGLVTAAGTVHAAYEHLAPTASAGVGVTMLAFLYLPNAVVAAASWGLGAGVGVGLAWASPFTSVAGAEVSSFPLLAVMPVHAPAWALLVLVLPVLAGVLVGRSCVRFAGPVSPAQRAWSALVAVGVTAVAAGVLALAAGGRLAAGTYDPVRVPAFWMALGVLAWMGLAAVAAAVLQVPERTAGRAVEMIRARREAARAAQVPAPDRADDPATVDAAAGPSDAGGAPERRAEDGTARDDGDHGDGDDHGGTAAPAADGPGDDAPADAAANAPADAAPRPAASDASAATDASAASAGPDAAPDATAAPADAPAAAPADRAAGTPPPARARRSAGRQRARTVADLVAERAAAARATAADDPAPER